EVVVISSSHNRRNHPAFEFRIYRAFQQVVGYQHFIHRRRSLDKVKGWTCIKDVLFTVCIIEMSSMPKLMSQYKNFVHAAGPRNQNIRMIAIRAGTESTG